jgi:hypothetical protein
MALLRSIAVLPRRVAQVAHRACHGVFHHYVRGVFAEHSIRRRALREGRTRWLNGFANRPSASGR